PDRAQDMAPALVRNAWALVQLGRLDEARSLFAEAIPHLRKDAHARPWTMAETAFALGEGLAIREVLDLLPPSTGQRAMLAVVDGRLADAADLYAELTCPLFEAEARLRRGEELVASGRAAEGE